MRRLPVLIVAAALLLAMALLMTRPKSEQVARPERAWSVETLPARAQSVRPTLDLFGRIESPQAAEMTAAVGADVRTVTAREGGVYEAGIVLIELDDREARLELIEREADVKDLRAQLALTRRRISTNRKGLEKQQELLAITERNVKRAEDLLEQSVLSQSDLDTTTETLKRQQLSVEQQELAVEESEFDVARLEAQIDRAVAQRDRAALDLERTRITAPFNAVVTRVPVSEGDRVRAGDPLIDLYNPDQLEVRAQFPGRYAGSIASGLQTESTLPVTIYLDGTPQAGQVVRVASATKSGSGGVDAFIEFDAAPSGLRLGSTVRVVAELPPEANVIAVPAETLYGRDRIFRVIDDRMQGLSVQRVGDRVTPEGESLVLIRSDQLSADDLIITTKISTAADGMKVAVAPAR